MLTLFAKTCDYSPTEIVKTIAELINLKTLSALTDDPNEWVHHKDVVHDKGLGVWQNRRNVTAFSDDAGKTYSLLSEGHLTVYGAPLHASKPHKD